MLARDWDVWVAPSQGLRCFGVHGSRAFGREVLWMFGVETPAMRQPGPKAREDFQTMTCVQE